MDIQYVKYAAQTVLAGASGTLSDSTTPFDTKRRTIVGIYCTDHTALVRTQIYVNGQLLVDIPNLAFIANRGPIDVNCEYPVSQYFDVRLQNGSSGTITNAEFIIAYKVG